jgi:hypothetical protein
MTCLLKWSRQLGQHRGWEYCEIVTSSRSNLFRYYAISGAVDREVATVDVPKIIAQLGLDGWELTSAESVESSGFTTISNMFFKRLLREGNESINNG